jgi:hypothetical protein
MSVKLLYNICDVCCGLQLSNVVPLPVYSLYLTTGLLSLKLVHSHSPTQMALPSRSSTYFRSNHHGIDDGVVRGARDL